MKTVDIFDDPTLMDQVFPGQGEEPIYMIVLKRNITDSSGNQVVVEIPIHFRVLSHVEIMRAYQAVTKRSKRNRQPDAVLNVEDYSVQQAAVFSAAVVNWEIVDLPRGKADKTRTPPQLSINELTTVEIQSMSEAIAPGLNKSGEDSLEEYGGISRADRKNVCKDAVADSKRSGDGISV